MKAKLTNSFIVLFLILFVTGCSKNDMEYKDPAVSAVDALYAPIENQQITLSSDQGATALFQWASSHSQDGQLVSYEVVFYNEADLEKPVYRIVSEKGGKELYASISHLDINRAAASAGIPTGEIGTIYWAVASWRGLSSAVSVQKNKLTVKRLEGFEVIPDAVFITGEATENGSDISQALSLTKTEEGKFEIYTQLKNEGGYRFVDRTTGESVSYYIDANAKLSESDGEQQSTVDETAVYRLTLDFTNKGVSMMKITSMGVFFSPENKVVLDLPYQGAGVWSGTGVINFRQESWGKDERYKFQLQTSLGTKQLGTVNGTDSQPTAASPASYYYVKLLDQTTQWDDKWKFSSAVDGVNTTVTVTMNASGPYTHLVKVN